MTYQIEKYKIKYRILSFRAHEHDTKVKWYAEYQNIYTGQWDRIQDTPYSDKIFNSEDEATTFCLKLIEQDSFEPEILTYKSIN